MVSELKVSMSGIISKSADQLFANTGVLLPSGLADIAISGVEYDSRRVQPGNMFFAIPGHKADGAAFVDAAVANGAVAVVAEQNVSCRVPLIECAPVRKVLAECSASFYDFPSREMIVAGVTGTNGKTTVCSMLKSIFEAGGGKAAQFGTLGHSIGDEIEPTVNTTPESRELQRLLRKARDANCSAVALEVSSHSLVQYRVHAIEFDIGVFTNLSSEHLDFHRNIEDYFSAKMVFFENLREAGVPAVVNAADPYGKRIAEFADLDVMTYGDVGSSDLFILKDVFDANSSSITVATPAGEIDVRLKMPGKFNAENAIAAIAVGIKCGISLEKIRSGLESFQPPEGRMQSLKFGQPFHVLIDYAHTPDALDRVLSSCRESTSGRLITVFGCGGDRDSSKRVPMARIVAAYSDIAILTSDNPRTEDPEKILDEVEGGFPDCFTYERESDRRQAIRMALDKAGPEDTVIIAGKGHENYQILGTTKVDFSEEEVVKEYFESGSWG